MLRHAHFDMKGGLPTFAASAKSKGQREEIGRSGYQPDFLLCKRSERRLRAHIDGCRSYLQRLLRRLQKISGVNLCPLKSSSRLTANRCVSDLTSIDINKTKVT
jgi:hypothetical protein